ncbi:MAG: carboxypeptidase M32 [Chitinophagaceae bacterium]|nr:carboxypeptidase M32 [Chitinophagaceae bacterium]
MIEKSSAELYNDYRLQMNKIADVRYASAVLQWDQETYLPQKGAAIRGQQIATLSEIAHRFFTDDTLGGAMQGILNKNDLPFRENRNVELTWEDYTKQKKFTSAFVRELSETVSKSYHSWMEARKANDFSLFAADLSKLIELKRKEADLLGYTDHPYNALLNDHDKGSTVALLDGVFKNMRASLKDIVQQIVGRPQVRDSFLFQYYPRDKQWEFGLRLIKELGYDLEAGRQDISEHPFTTNFNSNDVRITTRIHENDLSSMVWSCIHELGHALYEQGLPEDQYGLPAGEPASYSIHESQSRLWENHIGRSQSFCERYLPVLQEYFPDQLKNISVEDFYKGINKVQPSPIRTEADEVTYHFHVMIRYELEKKLIEGSLETLDIPGYWNEQYSNYLGIKIADDKQGCLQDVHWSHGSFGYFPTYSMGSFYAAQLFFEAAKAIPALESEIRKGNTEPLLKWLKTNIYRHGRTLTSEELCESVCGKPLDIHYFLKHILAKYKNIYNF